MILLIRAASLRKEASFPKLLIQGLESSACFPNFCASASVTSSRKGISYFAVATFAWRNDPSAIFLISVSLMYGNAQARPANSPVSVATFTFSPCLINSGTLISSPVSSFAGFVTLPLDVSPFTPGSV